jgi:hypothetical protein
MVVGKPCLGGGAKPLQLLVARGMPGPIRIGQDQVAKPRRCIKNVWPALSASDSTSWSMQSASTYPACELSPNQDGDPRALVLINFTTSSAIFLTRVSGRRSTVRPSRVHHPQTSSTKADADPPCLDLFLRLPPQPPRRTRYHRAARPTQSAPTCWPGRRSQCFMDPLQQSPEPTAQRRRAGGERRQGRACTEDQEFAQILVATFADPERSRLPPPGLRAFQQAGCQAEGARG